tara:strand:- start:110 stop:754 length:645 start_codon:yes stop_codon:yes gene_type:complete
MGKEYEFQILDVNVPKMRKLLKEHNGKRVHKNTRMVRSVFKRCNIEQNGYVRVRSENNKVTMTCKIYNNDKFPDEYEISLNEDFETGKKFLKSLNLQEVSYQETYREKWSLPMKGVNEITFDTWPGLPTFMEIDCTNITVMNKLKKIFNPDISKITYGATGKKYELYYGIPQKFADNSIPSMTFKNTLNEIVPLKNKEFFIKVVKDHKKKLKIK